MMRHVFESQVRPVNGPAKDPTVGSNQIISGNI